MTAPLDAASGFPVFAEVFAKSGAILAAALAAGALLRNRSADLRRLVLSAAVAVMVVAALLVPALPRWTAAAPAWFAPAAVAAPARSSPAPALLDPAPPLLPHRPSQAAAARPLRRVPLIPLLWFAGSALLLLRFLVGLGKLRGLRLASQPCHAGELPDYLRRMWHRRTLLLSNGSVAGPVTWGFFRPVILVPAGFEELPAECRHQVLCHELAHIQGRDFFLRALVELALAALWFQPLMWIVRRQLREEQELACDNRVLAAGARSSAYARLLLEWNDGLFASSSPYALGMAQRSCLKRRLYALLALDARRDTVSRAAVAAACLLGLAAALPLAAFRFAPAPQPVRPAVLATPPPVVAALPLSSPASTAAQAVAAARVAPDPPAPSPAPAAPPAVPDSEVVFEVASVKHGPPGDYSAGGNGGPGSGDPTRWSVRNYPMSSLLGIAYGINSYQLSGPAWLDEERFTVDARIPKETTKEQLGLMLRNLLVERFQLAAHFEKRNAPGYRLTVSKNGPKLAPSPGAPNPGDSDASANFKWPLDQEGYPELPPGRSYAMSVSGDRARWRFADETMDHFAAMIAGQIRQPILNATGLAGKYDLVISWSYAAMQPNAPAGSGPSIFAAVQEQLGLKLESQKIPVDTLIVDRLEKTPAEN